MRVVRLQFLPGLFGTNIHRTRRDIHHPSLPKILKYREHIFAVLLVLATLLFGGCATGYRIVSGVSYREFELPDNSSSAKHHSPCGGTAKSATTGNLKMDIYLPQPFDPGKQYSGVIFLYGCGWVKQNPAISRGDWLSHGIALAKKGCIGFAIDYRLAPDFFYPAAVDDARYALNLVTGKVNPEFIARYCRPLRDVAVAGFSSGGNIAALMGTGRADNDIREHLRCIVIYGGLMDLRKTAALPYKSRQAVDNNYLAGQGDAAYTEASPICNASKAFCPFLLQWGENDSWVPIAQARAMYDALQKSNIPVEKQFYDDGPHGFQFVDIGNGLAARERTVDFISRHLPPPH